MAQPNDVNQILDVVSKSREERAAKRAAENEAKDKNKRKRPGKSLPKIDDHLTKLISNFFRRKRESGSVRFAR